MLLLLLCATLVRAMFAPGWSPPACLLPKYRPSNVSIEVDRQYEGFVPSGGGPLQRSALLPTRFHVMNATSGRMETLFVRGVGYSPLPPSPYTFSRPFDVFTAEYSYLWKRDLPRIARMGANTIRVWSWDSYRDHSEFLDYCWEEGLYLMVPFMVDPQFYPDITVSSVRSQILTDWRAFVASVMNHPTVLAYLIGNELDSAYGAERDALFSLVNQMALIRDEVDLARHPMTMPLSDGAFGVSYVNPYYSWVSLDFWSLQTYRPHEYLTLPIMNYYESYVVNQSIRGVPFKPLVLTEFGVDAMNATATTSHFPTSNAYPPAPKEDEARQAKDLCAMFTTIRDNTALPLTAAYPLSQYGMSLAGVIGGAIVMEWNDEWWKANFADVRAPMCPNTRTELHTWCSHNVGGQGNPPYFLHEEWLGLCSQLYDPSETKLCLCPRQSYYAMTAAFACNGDEQCISRGGLDGFGCSTIGKPLSCSLKWCSTRADLFAVPYVSMLIPGIIILMLVVVALLFFRRQDRKAKDSAPEEPKPVEGYVQEETTSSVIARRLRSNIAEAFLRYCNIGTGDRYQTETGVAYCPYFRPAQERLFVLIWDRYVGFSSVSEGLIDVALRMVYDQSMENYFLWLGQLPPAVPSRDEMVCDLALMSIIQAWAGTINHCPEKICEIFEFSKEYFSQCVSLKHSAVRVAQVQDYHHGLVEIFRTYYLKVDEGEFTFEDINTDAILFRNERTRGAELLNTFWREEISTLKADDGQPAVAALQRDPEGDATAAVCIELDLLPAPELQRQVAPNTSKLHPFLEYHRERNPEAALLSVCGQAFFRHHATVCGTLWSSSHSFKQRGGVFTVAFVYGWILRIIVWMSVFANYAQPVSVSPPMCLEAAVKYLAVADSALKAILVVLHFRVLARLTRRIVLEGLFYIPAALALAGANIFGALASPLQTGEASLGNAFGMGLSINSAYVVLAGVVALIDEAVLIFSPTVRTYPLAGRFTKRGVTVRVRVAFFVTLAVVVGGLGLTQLPGLLPNGARLMDKISNAIDDAYWPTIVSVLWWVVFIVAVAFLPYTVARRFERTPKKGLDASRRSVHTEESSMLALNVVFWGTFFALNWVVNYYLLAPAVENINFTMCPCHADNPNLSREQSVRCERSYVATCYIAVFFSWLSAVLVSFVAQYGTFGVMMLLFGLFRAKVVRVGNVKTWQDVETHFMTIRERCFPRVSGALVKERQMACWNAFIASLARDCLLNDAERQRLSMATEDSMPDFGRQPRSEEAVRRIVYHMWSLESLLAHDEVGTSAIHGPYRASHRVRTMPTMTCVVPAYNETIIFDEEQLLRTRSPGATHQRITEIEYLVHTHPIEWNIFAERMQKTDASFVVNAENYASDLLMAYLRTPGYPPLGDMVRFEIRWWATMRGQTLARTIAGMCQWRASMLSLLQLEEHDIPLDEAQRIVSRKFQLVVSHQTYNPRKDVLKDRECHAEECMEICFRRLKYFDLVYNDDSNFQSFCKRLKPEAMFSAEGQEDLKYIRSVTVTGKDAKGRQITAERKIYNYFPREAYDILRVQRVGRLKIGEGKAENQMHALQFVNGMVLQAMDMNQYATFENGYKVPYLLTDYFGTPSVIGTVNVGDAPMSGISGESLTHESVIPPYRILGFTEWCYTRNLSLVGDLMGAAEWCFVTITQRVLNWPLGIRAHYGHPDFFDAFWVRNRGGQSKASPLVNTNEDIFAGYEMIGRGERCAFVEFVEAQKGRETTFAGAFTFEAKLAQGAAQQLRSYDVYRLNQGLNIFLRLSLFFSSMAFYITNVLMAVSINYYVLSIVLFAVSGVSYHKLGLLGAVIAVPWLVQIGYVLALPYFVELVIQKGFLKGVWNFIKTLPVAIFFFIFHLRTKTYFFGQGLFVGRGGYAGTGRGFGLDRVTLLGMYHMFCDSHYKEALGIGAMLTVYAIYGPDPPLAFFLRTFNIILIVVSWLVAPIVFNTAPTTEHLQLETSEMAEWIAATMRERVDLDLTQDKLRRIHFQRLLGLVTNMQQECQANIGDSEEAGTRDREGEPHTQDTTSQFHGVAQALEAGVHDEDMMAALRKVNDILQSSKDKLVRQIQRITTVVDSSPSQTIDGLMKEYWGNVESESWSGWLMKSIVSEWESEDHYFPGLINLFIQKLYLTVEMFTPWIILCVDQYHTDSLWFLALFLIVLAVQFIAEYAFRTRHEYVALSGGALLLVIPTAVVFYRTSIMTLSELLWSFALYAMVAYIALKTTFGVINARAKLRHFGWRGNPYHHVAYDALPRRTDAAADRLQTSVKNRSHEMESTNSNEDRRFLLFRDRLRFLRHVTTMRAVVPWMILGILAVASAVAVVFGEWLTTLNFNGRINEAWKMANVRASTSGNDKDDHDDRRRSAPLNRRAQIADDEAQSADAAVHGTISASLPTTAQRALRARERADVSRPLLATPSMMQSRPVPLRGQQSARTLMSMGSHRDELGERLLATASQPRLLGQPSLSHLEVDTARESSLSHAQPQPPMMFLNKFMDKYRS